MYSEKRNMRGIKRKITDNDEEDQLFNKSKTKLKDEIDTSLIEDNLIIENNDNLFNDETDKENSELKIDFLNNNDTSLNDILNSTTYLTQQNELNNKLDDELNELNELNNNDNQINSESFNSFLNTSLNNYVNSRPLTPLPQQSKPHEQSIIDQIQPQSSNQTLSPKENLSPLNTKLFNSTSSSLFNAAAIIDTYFSSSTKKSKLEKAKNMNHFRYSLFNKSLAKLNKFCNSSDPNIRNSVLVCNTLKRLERQLRKENIYLHLGSNGLAFVKLKNKRSNPEQLDYRNLILDETSHIYVEKNDNEDDNEQQQDENEDKFGLDDFCFATQQQTSSDSDELDSSEELDEEDEDNELINNSINEQISTNNSSICNNDLNTYLSSTTTTTTFEQETTLINNRINDNLTNEWTNDENNLDNNWTNMLTNLTSNQTENNLLTNDDNEQLKDSNQFNSNYLFNSIEQNVDQTNLTSTDEIFNDIDSLITLYDFDLSTNSTKIEQQKDESIKSKDDSQDNSNLFTDSGAIDLNLIHNSLNDSINSPINNSLNNSNNLSSTSCSTSISSSSASYSSNHQSNNTISVISSRV